jgi:hypothetical protein
MRALRIVMVLSLGLLGACGSDDGSDADDAADAGVIESPMAQWCVDPPAQGADGNGVLTLVKKEGQDLPATIAARFNDQDPADFEDDGMGVDKVAGDGIYSHAVTLDESPAAHECHPVVESKEGALEQGLGLNAECHTVACPPGCKSLLGFDCVVCVSCSASISLSTSSAK